VTEAHGGTEEVFNFELGGDYDIPVMSVLRSNK